MDQTVDSALEQERGVAEEVDHGESLSIPSVRPTSPSRRSFAATPVFDAEQTDYAATPRPPSRPLSSATPLSPPPELKDQEPGIFRRVFGGRRGRGAGEKGTVLSSVVGLYATQVTMLAAAMLGAHCLYNIIYCIERKFCHKMAKFFGFRSFEKIISMIHTSIFLKS